MKLKSSLPTSLKYQALVVETAALEAGLDFHDVVFELLDAADVNGIASYGGFPVRYPSWRFGMDYERLEKGYRWGLSKIYELVINNDPVYAYLVRSNSLLEQKLVMAHVFGHADFFKKNIWFKPTDRNMLDVMGNHATRIRRYVDAFGLEVVERFLDRVLSVETLIDPFLPLRQLRAPQRGRSAHTPLSERARLSLESLTRSPLKPPAPVPPPELRGPRLPTYDVLGYLLEHAPVEPWQRDILRMIRREAYYFSPQRMTQIMNEGWASFWHSRLLTRSLLEPSEIIDFADCHSGATAARAGTVNPYKLGIELYRYAEGRGEDIFALRKLHNDVSLIDMLVDEAFAERSYYFRGLVTPEGAPVDWRDAKAHLLTTRAWGGYPQIELMEHDAGRGALLLVHHHDGRDLQLERAGQTLRNLSALWNGTVELVTRIEGQARLLRCREQEVENVDPDGAEQLCRGDGPDDAPREAG